MVLAPKYLSISTLLLSTLVDNNHSYNQKNAGTVYILIWGSTVYEPFVFWRYETYSFAVMNCEYQNCFITNNSNFFEDLTNFDAILFNSIDTNTYSLPKRRSDSQFFVFVSTESAINYPQPFSFDTFYNYTMTYKLNSDIPYPYFYVRNNRGKIVAPNIHPQWIDIRHMQPAKISTIDRLRTKTKAAALFISNCKANNYRLRYITNLREKLQKYNLEVDIYGNCGTHLKCPRESMDECLQKIETDYYFFLAFENSFSEDYVTEKVLWGLNHLAVPIVYGGADYHRFMPDGIYLNANVMNEADLAAKMNELIQNKNKYYEYFKWHNHYTYEGVSQSTDTEPLCALCALLNNKEKRNERRYYHKFRDWWVAYDSTNGEGAAIPVENVDPNKNNIICCSNPRIESREPTISQSVSTFLDSLMSIFD